MAGKQPGFCKAEATRFGASPERVKGGWGIFWPLSDRCSVFASRTDQTPTPTRFLKNCEEVGLFNELASSFEHEFKKAAEDDEKKARGEGRQRCPKSEPCDISGPGGMELV